MSRSVEVERCTRNRMVRLPMAQNRPAGGKLIRLNLNSFVIMLTGRCGPILALRIRASAAKLVAVMMEEGTYE